MKEEFIERRIIIGMVISTEYLGRVKRFWNPLLLESTEFRKVAQWCIDYYQQYKRAPDDDIQSIYMEQLSEKKISKAEGKYIEIVMDDLSDEYGRGTQFNAGYLYDQTIKYFKGRELVRHSEEVQSLNEQGHVEEAETLARSYTSTIISEISVGLDLSSKEALSRMGEAFNTSTQQVLSYPGALGKMWNEHLIRGGFISLLGPEKRGKTFLLMDMAMRGLRQKANIAFFQAGDMTEAQQLKRIGVYLARCSDKEKYCVAHLQPVGDCVYNQLDICTRKDRNCDHGIFEVTEDYLKENYEKLINKESLIKAYKANPQYEPCDSFTCPKRKGTPWVKMIPQTQPLTGNGAKKALRRFFKKYKRRFKLVTFPAGHLTPGIMRECLDAWENEDGFVPDIILTDYADIMASDEGEKDFRQKTNSIWMGLRGLSQERYALLLTATQADTASYEQKLLTMSNFSEDKRKYAHVTAMYGLNQDPKGREKSIGILRINELVVREGDFSSSRDVTVLQDLATGRPFLESF